MLGSLVDDRGWFSNNYMTLLGYITSICHARATLHISISCPLLWKAGDNFLWFNRLPWPLASNWVLPLVCQQEILVVGRVGHLFSVFISLAHVKVTSPL